MKISTCNENLDEILFKKPVRAVIYGAAGSGKTNLLLSILKCSKVDNLATIFISTEGMTFINRVTRLSIETKNIYFALALSQDHLISLILDSLKYRTALIIIDSINHLYRVEFKENGSRNPFTYLLVLLNSINEKGVTIIASAQVRFDENTPAGFEYLEAWCDTMLELSVLPNKTRVLKIIKPALKTSYKFVITDYGITWL
jgi:predicted ATP-dependent serine protease